jgi:hypothetical protein
VVDAQPPDSGIKNPNRHGPALDLGRRGVHVWHGRKPLDARLP